MPSTDKKDPSTSHAPMKPLRCQNLDQGSQSQTSSNKHKSDSSKQKLRKKKKYLKFFVNFELKGRNYELDFIYDLQKDNP